MGYLARQLLQLEPTTLIQSLTQAYADEWFAHYTYWFVANTVCGPASPAVIRMLQEKADRALLRANRFAARITELGGQPIAKLTELVQHATDKPFKLSDDVRDLDGALKAVLDAERTSLRTYQRLYEATRDKDPVTQRLAREFFVEAVHGEEALERLLGERAPELEGER
jgi:ferritin-like protein